MPREEKKGFGKWIAIGILGMVLLFGWTSYNGLVSKDENVEGAWGNVQTEYQSRADKVKNLVETVKGAAKYENETLIGVVEARAKALSGLTINIDDLTPEKMAEFEKMQGEFTGSLSKLLAVFESYPDLQAVQSFRDFQSQYEGIENRIAKSRRDFNETVKDLNKSIRKFPINLFNMMYGFEKREYFEADAGTEEAPDVDFEF